MTPPARHLVLGAVLTFVSGAALAQGVQSGALSGTVSSQDGQPLPGVTVSISSPALLGSRSTVSDANGGYIFKALPPGPYKITFEISQFATLEKSVTVALGASVPVDASMALAAVQESVTVTAESPTPLNTTAVGANYRQEMVDRLPTGRTLAAVAQLAPGLTDKTPNAGQVSIAGNFAYDNVFLIDGVDVNDNLFGNANNLFIEDAIQETQVLTSGISAEYGRFGGGVINAVTKNGGNAFSGSFRVNFSNPSWRDETPIEKQQGIARQDKLNNFDEATFGGPIVKDRLWFFAAGRRENSRTQLTLPESGLPFTQTDDQKRGEIKLTGAITPNHQLTATYTDVSDSIYRLPFGTGGDIDPVHDAYQGQQPISLFSLKYTGTLRHDLFLEGQYSQKRFAFQDSGGTSPNIIDSPYLAQSVFAAYNAPYFDATDPEDRNNRQFAGALSYFLSTQRLGKHDLKVGFESYRSTRTGGNSQSSTNYVFYTDYLTDQAGKPAFDADGYVIPVFTPGLSQLQNWQAVRGAGIDLTTNSAYLNDKWTLGPHWSFNLGARAEWAKGEATSGIQPVNTNVRVVPRLAAAFDPRGDGRFKLDASYSQYAGKYSETQFANNTNVGNPDAIYYLYTGPAGQGRGFAPGIDPANYSVVLGGVFPTANVLYDPNIKSPVTKEWTVGAGTRLGERGSLSAVYTNRKVSDFVTEFVTLATGSTDVVRNGVDFGSFSNILWGNTSDPVRDYQGLQFQSAYRVTDRWSVQGHYTLQLKNDGNYEGEATNQPGAPSVFSGFYPEIFAADRTYPTGPLAGYEKNKVRLWTLYDLGLGKAGEVNLGLLYRYDSGTAYSIRSTGVGLTATQRDLGAGYATLPPTQTVYYSVGRGSERFDSSNLVDVSLTYDVPIYRSAKPWVKLEVRNVLDRTPLISANISTRPDPDSPVDSLGLPTGYLKGSLFGQGTSTSNYPFPREYFVSMGLRF